MAAKDNPIAYQGQIDFSGGVDALKTPTVVSVRNPNGLGPNQLAWLKNATMRGGAITPRDGYKPQGNINLGLPPQTIPGAPAQSIPQPPVPPVQTPTPQDLAAQGWTVPVVGARVTLTNTPGYVGNVGDTTSLSATFPPITPPSQQEFVLLTQPICFGGPTGQIPFPPNGKILLNMVSPYQGNIGDVQIICNTAFPTSNPFASNSLGRWKVIAFQTLMGASTVTLQSIDETAFSGTTYPAHVNMWANFVSAGASSSVNYGTFLVTGFTGTTTSLQTSSTTMAGSAVAAETLIFTLVSLGPSIPQPPVILPPGQPTIVPDAPTFNQGWHKDMYRPKGPDSFSPNGTPYAIGVISGHVIAVDPDFNVPPVDLSNVWGLTLPITARCYFEQAEQFLIIQAGDYNPATGQGTLPLFWDGFTLKQSNGLTGVISVGQPLPNFFAITPVNGWTPPAVGQQVTLTLPSPYGGANQHLGDNLQINNAATSVGTFRVVGISGNNITLKTLILVTSTPIAAGTTLTCTLSLPPTPTNNVIVGAGFWSVPKVGSQGAVNLTALYFGSVGDTVLIQSEDASITYGTFQVVSIGGAPAYQLVLKNLGPANSFSGTQVAQGNFLFTVQSPRTFFFQQLQNQGYPWVVAPVGGVTTFQWSGSQGGSTSFLDFTGINPEGPTQIGGGGSQGGVNYAGHLYDIVQVTDVVTGVNYGIFRVVAAPPGFPPFFEQVGLQTIQSNFVGQRFSQAHARFTVIAPPSNPQIVTYNTGQWTMPAVGASVQLQVDWLGTGDTPSEGPAYPGSVGDTVQITQLTPTLEIGQFLVTALDFQGNVTLQSIVPTGGFTNLASGTVIVGPTTVTMTILSPPSSVGTLISQLPAATVMKYYQGILFYAQGDVVSGGDVVGGPSGTAAYNYTDSVLSVTENPLAFGGDGFKLPIPGNITGMDFPAQINASLGQGLLMIGTIYGICSLQVPSNRTDWIAASSNNQPQINVVQSGNGWTDDWGIVSINGDLYFPSLEPSIRSLLQAVRYFQQQGNVSIASNESRVLGEVNTNLLGYANGIFFNNRLLMAMVPIQTPFGVVHKKLIPLDMEPISTLEEQLSPNWEGETEGLQILQLLTATFNGTQRAFIVALNETTPGQIDLWEIVINQKSDYNFSGLERRIAFQVETPSFTWEKEDELKKLVVGRLWIDKLAGVAAFEVDYRPDASECWIPWKKWQVCSARNSGEQAFNPQTYPVVVYLNGYRQPMTLPFPPTPCENQMKRPANIANQFQFRVTVIGYCRIRGLFWGTEDRLQEPYSDLIVC